MGTTIHDLDRDGYPEVLFANHDRLNQAEAAIYWSDEGNFSESSRTELPTTTANAVTVAGGCP
jgi:hypothetical protein